MKYFVLLLALGAGAAGAQTGRADPRVLDSIAGAGIAQNRAVGIVAAVVKGNDTLLMKAYGKADVEWDAAMTTDAMFEIGSVSKQFAAASILQLLDAGKLSLEDDITKWLPNVATGGTKITLRHLLSHTSGIHGFGEDGDWEVKMFLPNFPRDSAWKLVRLDPFLFAPGAAQAYSNSGFWLLGAVVEKASGMKYVQYLDEHIFKPLGMKRSTFCNSSAPVLHRARGYHMRGGTILRAPLVNYAWVFAPGGICSTAGDLVTWLKALHGGKVLAPKSYAEMTTPAKLNDGTTVHYGMGIKVGEDFRGLRYIGHGGTAPGFRADATWYPGAQLAVVVLMNTSPAPISPGGIGGELAREVLPWPRPAFTFYAGDPSPFVGRYVQIAGGNGTGMSLEVSPSPAGLAFSINGSRPETLPWAGGLTFYAQESVTLTFRRANGDSGAVIEVRRDDPGNHVIFRKQ
jgi:CubicO group peptidase (beta-lactamase class C family)